MISSWKCLKAIDTLAYGTLVQINLCRSEYNNTKIHIFKKPVPDRRFAAELFVNLKWSAFTFEIFGCDKREGMWIKSKGVW